MTHKELKRVAVMEVVVGGGITHREAAEVLGLSVRQVMRLKKAYREKGAAGLAHSSRGRVSPRRMSEAKRRRIIELVKRDYADYNTQHLMEVLREEHGIKVSYTTLRRVRQAANLPSPRRRRVPRHYARRERKPLVGMLLRAMAVTMIGWKGAGQS